MKTLTQKEQTIKLLREAGKFGVNSYGVARELMLQLPARIWDLKADGYEISSIPQEDKSVTYVLTKEIQPKTEVKYMFIGNRAIRI